MRSWIPRFGRKRGSQVSEVNSQEYWDERHTDVDWERRNIFAMAIAIDHIPNEGRVLVAGCAQGREVFELARMRPDLQSIVGVDFSQVAIHKAREILWTHPDRRLEDSTIWTRTGFFCVELHRLEKHFTKRTFDYVICIETLEHVKAKYLEFASSQLMYMLKEHGKLLLTVPGPNSAPDPEHPHNWNEQMVYDLFKGKEAYSINFYTVRVDDRVVAEITRGVSHGPQALRAG